MLLKFLAYHQKPRCRSTQSASVKRLLSLAGLFCYARSVAQPVQADSCSELKTIKLNGVEITAAETVAVGRAFGPYPTATQLDVDKAALHVSDPLVEPASTNLTTFAQNGGKLIFFHGDSDPWFSALDTLGYYQSFQ